MGRDPSDLPRDPCYRIHESMAAYEQSPVRVSRQGDEEDQEEEHDNSFVFLDKHGVLVPLRDARAYAKNKPEHMFTGMSCRMQPNHPLRAWCIRMACDPCLEWAILAVILLNCFFLLALPPNIPLEMAIEHVTRALHVAAQAAS